MNLSIISAGNDALNVPLSHKHLKIELHNNTADVVPSPTSFTTYLVSSTKISWTDLSIGYSNAIDLTKNKLYSYLKDNIASIKALIEELDIKYPNDSKSLLKGKEIVITGTLTNSRNFYKDKIEDNGGILSNNVSNKTSYLLLGDNPGSKYQKALSLDIPIISEDEFMKLLN